MHLKCKIHVGDAMMVTKVNKIEKYIVTEIGKKEINCSGFGNRRDDRVKTTERSRERWNKERRPTYRKDDSQYRNTRQRGRINNFTKKPPAFNVEKENFPSLGGKDSASVETKKSEKQQEEKEEKEEQQPEDSDKKTIKTYFKDIIKNKKKKFAQAPNYSVEPGWIKMRLSKGKIIKTEGPKVKKIHKTNKHYGKT